MIIFVTTADTEILALDAAVRLLPPSRPALHAVAARDLLSADDVRRLLDGAPGARVVVARLLGGRSALGDAFVELQRECARRAIALLALPGDAQPDTELAAACTVSPAVAAAAFDYLLHGGVANMAQLVRFLADELLGASLGYEPAADLPWDGLYHPDLPDGAPLDAHLARHDPARPTVGVLFYRAAWMSGDTAAVNAMIRAIEERGANALCAFCYTLKDEDAAATGAPAVMRRSFMHGDGSPLIDTLISTLSFSIGALAVEGATVSTGWSVEYLRQLDIPITQAALASSTRAQWQASAAGLSPTDAAMKVAMPEFDGHIIGPPVAFREVSSDATGLGAHVSRLVPDAERTGVLADQALGWARLRRSPNADKRIAIVLANYPTKNARIGNAVGLDSTASVVALLRAMRDAGYDVRDIPGDGDDLVRRIIERCSNDREFLTADQLRHAAGHVPAPQYDDWFARFPEAVRQRLREHWGEPPGAVYLHEGALAMAGIDLGNVYVGLQPPRGFGENVIAIYHDPDLPPTHHYLAYYRWLRDVWGAHAVLHVGKHGTLEWLPGKALGLSGECFPDAALPALPHIYPFIINNPGEGTQAKRRSHAVIVDHLIPAMTTADTYNEIAQLEGLLDEYYQIQTLDPKKLPMVRERIWELVVAINMNRDLGVDQRPDDAFDNFLLHIDGYLCELKDAQIRDGLHTLGETPQGEQRLGLLLAMSRLDNAFVPGLRPALARALGLDYDILAADRGLPLEGPLPETLAHADPSSPLRTTGDAIERLELLARALLAPIAEGGATATAALAPFPDLARSDEVRETLAFLANVVVPRLDQTPDEIANVLRALEGRYVPAGPSGSPTRGMPNVLPTGRNFYSVDPRSIPSALAWEVGRGLADGLVAKYLDEEGAYPRSVGLVIWGTSAMRTHGDDVAEALALLGVRPKWQRESGRVVGLEVMTPEELGRPRVDVTVRISGFFRDAFPNLVHLMDEAVELVAALNEPPEVNPIAATVREETARRIAGGEPHDDAAAGARYRIFGSKPGTYGAGILPLLDARTWKDDRDLAAVYEAWGSYVYTRRTYGADAPREFRTRFAAIEVAAKNQDNREHDIFDSDDYMQYHGGMIATIRALRGSDPRQFFGDSSDPSRLRTRDLADEARRVFRTRVVNPKWIASVMRHGYRGGAEMAATVDYMFGYDATARVIDDWMYEDVTKAYTLDPQVQRFLREHNPWALRGMIERLLEAAERGLWENPDPATLDALRALYLDLDAELEGAPARGGNA